MTNNNADLFACMSSTPTVKAVQLKKDLTEVVVTKVRPWDKVRTVTKNGYASIHNNNSVAQSTQSTSSWDLPYADR